MKAVFSAFFAAVALLVSSLGLRAQTQSPFVETTTLTFYWSFTESYVFSVNTPVPTLPEVATFDPNTLPSGFETYTDTTTVRPYTGPIVNHFAPAGANSQIISLLLQRLIRNGQLPRQATGWRWQLIAVREAPANVRELATNPYRVFLSNGSTMSEELANFGPENVVDDPVPSWYTDSTPTTPVVTLDTGLTITLGQFNGSYKESNWTGQDNAWVRNASGSVATAFRIDFGALFYDDPLHNQGNPSRAPYNFHLARNYWEASAAGLINYGIRSVAGPLPTFVATNSSATGTGWFYHERSQFEPTSGGGYRLLTGVTQTWAAAGTAPLKVTMSTIQYQKRGLFRLAAPTAPSFPQTETMSDTSVQVSWFDTAFNETGFILERRIGEDGEWEEVSHPDRNTTTYLDTELTPDTVYFYRLRAFNGGGVSDPSEAASASTISAPSNLEAGPLSATEVGLTWIDNADDPDRQETHFELQRIGPDEDDVWVTITVAADLPPNTEAFTDATATASTEFNYRIRAIDEYGASAWSNIDEATTPAPAAEGAGGGN